MNTTQTTQAAQITRDLQGQILDAVRKGQAVALEAISTWADAVHPVTSVLPVPAASFTRLLPRPSDVVASTYDFAEQLLAARRKFAEDALRAAEPAFHALTTQPAAEEKAEEKKEAPAK